MLWVWRPESSILDLVGYDNIDFWETILKNKEYFVLEETEIDKVNY